MSEYPSTGNTVGSIRRDDTCEPAGNWAVFAETAEGLSTWQDSQLGLPGMAIAGGTDEILRNVIGERVLGLRQNPVETLQDSSLHRRYSPTSKWRSFCI